MAVLLQVLILCGFLPLCFAVQVGCVIVIAQEWGWFAMVPALFLVALMDGMLGKVFGVVIASLTLPGGDHADEMGALAVGIGGALATAMVLPVGVYLAWDNWRPGFTYALEAWTVLLAVLLLVSYLSAGLRSRRVASPAPPQPASGAP